MLKTKTNLTLFRPKTLLIGTVIYYIDKIDKNLLPN